MPLRDVPFRNNTLNALSIYTVHRLHQAAASLFYTG